MKTLPRYVTDMFFHDPATARKEMRRRMRSAVLLSPGNYTNGLPLEVTAAHYVVYAILRGKDYRLAVPMPKIPAARLGELRGDHQKRIYGVLAGWNGGRAIRKILADPGITQDAEGRPPVPSVLDIFDGIVKPEAIDLIRQLLPRPVSAFAPVIELEEYRPEFLFGVTQPDVA